MHRWIWVVVALLAMSCGAPQPPEEWTVERQAGANDRVGTATICSDIEDIALGDLADEDDLLVVLDELSHLAAVLGATTALPAFDTVRDALSLDTGSLDTGSLDTGSLDTGSLDTGSLDTGSLDSLSAAEADAAMLTAATSLDDAGWAACEIPAFTAIYASTGWPACHGEMAIAVTLRMARPDPTERSCSSADSPLFLPCWTDAGGGFLPVDCVSGTILTAVDGGWGEAGPARAPTPTTTTTTVVTTTSTTAANDPTNVVPVISAIDRPECDAIVELFTGADPLRGDETDLARLTDAAASLDATIAGLASDFEWASAGGWSLDEFEGLVIDLDGETADACGIPLISAAYALVGGVEELPCWRLTGHAYPSYEPTSCEIDQAR